MPDPTPIAARPVRLHNYLAYGSNDVLGAGSMAVISGWVLIFYTQFCGLSAGQAATIFAVARILDAFASPMIGYISDHFGGTWLGQRFGRRRFFILAAIPLLPSFALMWLPGQGFWYYLVSYVLFELVYAMEIIPFETLAAEMSSDYRTKAKFAGSRILFGQASAILAGFLPLWLIEALGRDSADTFFYMGVIFAILFMATAGLLYAFSWERHLPTGAAAQVARHRAGGPGQALKALYRNLFSTMRIRAFRLHLGMYLGGYISQDIFNAAFTFFVIFALAGSTAIASGLLGTMYIVQFVAVIIAINLALRASPSRAYQVAAADFAVGVLALVALWLLGVPATSPWIWLPIILAGLGHLQLHGRRRRDRDRPAARRQLRGRHDLRAQGDAGRRRRGRGLHHAGGRLRVGRAGAKRPGDPHHGAAARHRHGRLPRGGHLCLDPLSPEPSHPRHIDARDRASAQRRAHAYFARRGRCGGGSVGLALRAALGQ